MKQASELHTDRIKRIIMFIKFILFSLHYFITLFYELIVFNNVMINKTNLITLLLIRDAMT